MLRYQRILITSAADNQENKMIIDNNKLGYTIYADLPGFLQKYRAFPLSGNVKSFDCLEDAEKYCVEMYNRYVSSK